MKTKGTKGGIFVRRARFADTALSQSEFEDIRLSLLTVRRPNGTARLPLRGRDLHGRFGARLTDCDVPAVLRYVLGSGRHITHLDLSFNHLTDAGFRTLLERLLANPDCTVTHLDVAGNELTAVSLAHLQEFTQTIRITHLRLSGNAFGPGASKALAGVLAATRTIVVLDVDDTDLTLATVAAVVAALRGICGCNSLRSLGLSRILSASLRYPLETKWLAYHVELLLEHNKTLTELRLRKNTLAGPDMEAVVRGLRADRALLVLDVGYNNLGDRGAELLADYLRDGPRLRVLNVAGNGIRDAGARALGVALPYSKIRVLDVSDNRMTDGGVLEILTTIKKPYFLQILNVWGNEVGPESCAAIERMLQSGVLRTGALDVRVYGEEGAWRAARCVNEAAGARGEHVHCDVPDYGWPQPIYHIRREISAISAEP